MGLCFKRRHPHARVGQWGCGPWVGEGDGSGVRKAVDGSAPLAEAASCYCLLWKLETGRKMD